MGCLFVCSSAINSVSWSPSGAYVASVEKGSKAILWSDMWLVDDVETETLTRRMMKLVISWQTDSADSCLFCLQLQSHVYVHKKNCRQTSSAWSQQGFSKFFNCGRSNGQLSGLSVCVCACVCVCVNRIKSESYLSLFSETLLIIFLFRQISSVWKKKKGFTSCLCLIVAVLSGEQQVSFRCWAAGSVSIFSGCRTLNERNWREVHIRWRAERRESTAFIYINLCVEASWWSTR